MTWVLGSLVAVAALLTGALWLGQRSLMYYPDTSVPPPAAEMVDGAEDVVLTTEDGLDLNAWYLPPSDACASVVLLAHGNGGNLTLRAGLIESIGARGLGVLAFDYRGYGGNPGHPSEVGLARDARAAREHLLARGHGQQDLIYLGESLGTGVVSELATEFPPAAMVLRSPMTSFGEVVRDLYRVPIGALLRDRYPVVEHVSRSSVPLAVVYGDADTIVPADQSRRVADVARGAGASVVEVPVEGMDHNDLELTQGAALIDALVAVAEQGGVTGCGG